MIYDRPTLLATMAAQIYSAGTRTPEGAVADATMLLEAAEEAAQKSQALKDPGRIAMSLHGIDANVPCSAEHVTREDSLTDSHRSYDVIHIGDITLFFERAQTIRLRNVLTALIDAKQEGK